MTLSTNETVRETYRLALQQEITLKLKARPDWDRYLAIAKDGRDRLEAEQTSYRDDYTQRLADARAIVLRERTGLHYDQPKPPGGPDPFDKDNIDAVATLRVQHDHSRRVSSIIEDEIDGYRTMRAELVSRDQKQGLARDRFNQASPNRTRTQQR